jgi:hypothetical protein
MPVVLVVNKSPVTFALAQMPAVLVVNKSPVTFDLALTHTPPAFALDQAPAASPMFCP